MQLKEISDSVYEIDGKDIYYSFGRKLIDEQIPEDKDVLLLLDPLFTTIFIDNLKKVLESGKDNVTILFIPFDNLSPDTVDKYFSKLEDALPLLKQYKNCKVNFITPFNLEINYLDKTYFKLKNPLFMKIINSFENEYASALEEERRNA